MLSLVIKEAAGLCRLILSRTSQMDVGLSRACWSSCPSALIEELTGRSSAHHCLNPTADSSRFSSCIAAHCPALGWLQAGLCRWVMLALGAVGAGCQLGFRLAVDVKTSAVFFLSLVLKPSMKAKQKLMRDQEKWNAVESNEGFVTSALQKRAGICPWIDTSWAVVSQGWLSRERFQGGTQQLPQPLIAGICWPEALYSCRDPTGALTALMAVQNPHPSGRHHVPSALYLSMTSSEDFPTGKSRLCWHIPSPAAAPAASAASLCPSCQLGTRCAAVIFLELRGIC